MENNQITIQPEESYKVIRKSVLTAQSKVYTAVNSAMVQAYWEIGQEIHKACGKNDRAEYGKKLLEYLSEHLTKEFGKGFTVTNLKYMRQFYRAFPIRHTLCDELSWSHYRLLMRIENENARKFYMEETVKSGWSVRQLERQIGTFYYERLLASQDKESVKNEIGLPEKIESKNIVRDPYVLEFLGLEGKTSFYEKDLEQAIIDHLQKFLLELGRGFSFVARQQKITFDGRNFFIDLVFYNYILKCFVIIDLKLGDLTHQDLGQMQMYVNYYTREMMNEGDNPPIGIVLCADKSDQIVKYTLPEENNQIFASKYKLYLPTEEEFKKELNLDNYVKKDEDKNKRDYNVKIGIVATGDVFCSEVDMRDEIRGTFNADAVDMECGAIGQVCYLDNVPFIVIRGISDTPDGNNAGTFDKNLELASKRCSEVLNEILSDEF